MPTVVAPHSPTASSFVRETATHRQSVALTLCATWLIAGLLTDSWAHTNKPGLESFWTPWHGVMYSGGGACIIAIGLMMLRNVKLGATIRESVPIGFEWAVCGAGLIAFSGVGDLIWHTVFGIEQNLRIFFSPTHITLIVGIALVAGAAWRAAVVTPRAPRWTTAWPVVLSAAMVAMAFGVITGFASATSSNVLRIDDPATLEEFGLVEFFQNLGILNLLGSILLVSIVIAGAARTVHLPRGATLAMTVLMTAGLTSDALWDNWEIVVAFGIGGIVAELATYLVSLRRSRGADAVVAGGSLAAGIAGGYVAVTAARYHLYLPAELWTGTIVWAGLLGSAIALGAGSGRAVQPRCSSAQS